jgi:diguanylate cyclase (GGDEF)-like protein
LKEWKVISLKKAFHDLDRASLFEECCRSTLESVRQYPVILNAELAEGFQEQVGALLLHLDTAQEPHSFRSRFRAALREYQHQSHQVLARLRSDMEATMTALREVTEVLTSRDEDQQLRLRDEVSQLRKLADSDGDLEALRRELRQAVTSIADCVQQIERENRLVVAQLKHELSLLHRKVDLARRASAFDPVTGLFHAAEMKARIAQAVASADPFSLLFFRITNFRRLALHAERQLLDGALADLAQRLKRSLAEADLAGRWSEDEFVALVTADRVRALQASKEAASRLSGPYSVFLNGLPQAVSLSVASGVVESKLGEDLDSLLRRCDQLLRVLVG